MSGFVNKQNCRFWGQKTHKKFNVKCIQKCGFWSEGVIDPYFFQDANGNIVTVNGERY